MSSSCLGSWRWPASSHLARGTPVPQPEEQREFVLRPRGGSPAGSPATPALSAHGYHYPGATWWGARIAPLDGRCSQR